MGLFGQYGIKGELYVRREAPERVPPAPLPALCVMTYPIGVGRAIRVVRDDLLPGGTKMRGLLPWLSTVPQKKIIYATPAQGYAQIALAAVCQMRGKRAVLFAAKRKELHPRTLRAVAMGATLFQVPYGYLNVTQMQARIYAQDKEVGGFLLPFGADMPEMQEHYVRNIRGLNERPSEIWCIGGSGVLTRSLQVVFPGVEHHVVKVGAQGNYGSARVYDAPEKYERPAKYPPPFPSCDNYDAKAWQFIVEHAKDNALFWNVAA